jgi:hypothetical protein
MDYPIVITDRWVCVCCTWEGDYGRKLGVEIGGGSDNIVVVCLKHLERFTKELRECEARATAE